MGNQIARSTQVSASEYYLHDFPSSHNLVLIKSCGRDRLFKSILCKHDEGLVLVKVYFKRGHPLDLKDYRRRLSDIRDIFRNLVYPHVCPYQFWLETDKAAYLLRQYFFSTLHDRLNTRPFLSLIEKKWLVFQLLCAVNQIHENGVCHGDIKCENVLVTSWNWLYLADFAPFKPTYLPDDQISLFPFFFQTGETRRCYLAPERFYEHGGEMKIAPDAPLKPSMDVFSVGCVIAQLFVGGTTPLFEYQQLLLYCRGQYDPSPYIEKIQDAGIRNLIYHMIQLDPESRLSCDGYLRDYASVVFPTYFSPYLHKLFSCLIPLDSDTRVAMTQSAFSDIHKQLVGGKSTDEVSESATGSNFRNDELLECTEFGRRGVDSPRGSINNNDEQEKGITGNKFQFVGDIASLLREVEQRNHHSYIGPSPKSAPYTSFQQSYVNASSYESQQANQFKRHSSNYPILWRKILKDDLNSLMDAQSSHPEILEPFFPLGECKMSCEGMVLIASLLCSCVRNVKQPHLRRGCLLLLKSTAFYIDDEDRLQHVLPYVVAMFSDPAAIVRSAALETLCDVVSLIREFPPSDAKVFPEYILPMLSMFPDDPEESVRISYASNIFKIALTAYRFLSLAAEGSNDESSLPHEPQSQLAVKESSGEERSMKFNAQLSQLRKSIAEVVQELVIGPKQTPCIRRALLQDIGHLCYFFGQRQCNDFLLPILPAFLNDRDDQLRAVFYGQIIFVCYFVGQSSVEEYLLPYIEQALGDEMEAVMVNALECLSVLCKSGFLRKRILLGMIEKVCPLLCYPIQWVRRSAVTFIAESSECLGELDSCVYLAPVLHPFLQREPASLSSPTSLLSCLKPPVSKMIFYQDVENTRSSDMLERQRKIWYSSSPYLKQWETVDHTRKMAGDTNHTKSSILQDPNELGTKYAGTTVQKASLPVADDVATLRLGTSLNGAGSLDIRDSLNTDKLQISDIISPQVSAGRSFLYDGSSEGVPLYSVYMEKHAAGTLSAGNDSSSCLPLLDPVKKKVNQSSSVAPKLASSSFYNMNNISKPITRSVPDSEGRDDDQSSYVTSKFQDVTIYENLKGTLSVSSGDDVSPYEVTGLPSFARISPTPDMGWRPQGVLIAHLQEHRSSVNDIAVSNDHSFFVSASDDSTVKVWDTRRLERDISFRSRLTYALDGSQALCTTMLSGTEQVVVGASDGSLHLFSVDYISRGPNSVVERYSGIADIKKKEVGEGAILSLINCSNESFNSHTVFYSTQRCGTHLWDTRMSSASWKFQVLPEEGYISSLIMGQCGNWFVSGSSRGVLTLWDLRFLLPVNSWQYSTVCCPVEKMSLFIPPSNSVSITARPLVYVAAGCNEVSLWNAENGSCHQVFRVGSGESVEVSKIPRALARPLTDPSSKQDVIQNTRSKYRVNELNEPAPCLPGIRSLLPLPGGDLLTGGTDLKIRYWDHTSPDQSYSVCGPSLEGVGSDEYYDIRSNFGTQFVQERRKRPLASKLTQKDLLSVAATDPAGCHRDSVLSLASVKLNQRLLISSSRDGAIKVWK